MNRFKNFYRNAPIFTKFAVFIPLVTVFFWVVSSVIGIQHIKSRLESDFVEFNTRIVKSLAGQTAGDLRYSDFMQVKRIIKDFYDPAYMSYLAVYSTELSPVAVYPIRFKSADLAFMERQISDFSGHEFITNFHDNGKGRLFHFQSQIKDEHGKVIGYMAMGGNTGFLTAIVKRQLLYFTVLGIIVLALQIIAIVYLTRVFTKPFKQITKTLHEVREKEPSDLISTLLTKPPLESACAEANAVDTALRKLLATVQSHQEEAKRLAIQASIGNVVAHVAHDLRNPLTTLKKFIAAVKNAIAGNKEMSAYAESADRSADRMNLMVEDLLDYKKARNIMPSVVEIRPLFKDVLGDVDAFAAEKGIEIISRTPPMLFARIDSKKMHRVLANILLNAIQAIDGAGGRIEMEASALHGDTLILSVKDNGCGISDENVSKIFDNSFSFGKPNGTGLGLSYCRNVIEAHGGAISVESRRGKGSRFVVTLPGILTQHNRAGAADNKTAGQEPMKVKGNGKRPWLLIEDDPCFRETWRDIFAGCGLPSPVEVTHPKELVGSNIDYREIEGAIVDYDFDSSRLTGADLIEFLKRKGMKKIFFCSALFDDDTTAKEVMEAGAIGIIPKPPTPESFKNILS